MPHRADVPPGTSKKGNPVLQQYCTAEKTSNAKCVREFSFIGVGATTHMLMYLEGSDPYMPPSCRTATLLIVESSDLQSRCPSDIPIPVSPLTLSWIQMYRYAAFDTFQSEPQLQRKDKAVIQMPAFILHACLLRVLHTLLAHIMSRALAKHEAAMNLLIVQVSLTASAVCRRRHTRAKTKGKLHA
jgi:hypothetical protein